MTARNLLAVLVALLAGPLAAQDGLMRLAEMPAHRALLRAVADGTAPVPFETDGCSGGLSTVWDLVADQFPSFAAIHQQAPPWEGCCVTHDRAYHNAGGTTEAEASYDARLAADDALQACVIATGDARQDVIAAQYGASPEQVRAAYRTIAGAMHMAVRFGGAPCSGLPWRWGFGFAQCSVLDLAGE
jgi:hypothetical protein